MGASVLPGTLPCRSGISTQRTQFVQAAVFAQQPTAKRMWCLRGQMRPDAVPGSGWIASPDRWKTVPTCATIHSTYILLTVTIRSSRIRMTLRRGSNPQIKSRLFVVTLLSQVTASHPGGRGFSRTRRVHGCTSLWARKRPQTSVFASDALPAGSGE